MKVRSGSGKYLIGMHYGRKPVLPQIPYHHLNRAFGALGEQQILVDKNAGDCVIIVIPDCNEFQSARAAYPEFFLQIFEY